MKKEAEKLMDLKAKIEKAKTDKAQTEGRLSQLFSDLEKIYGCKTLTDAEEKMKEYDKDVEKLRKKLDEGIEKLKGTYDEW